MKKIVLYIFAALLFLSLLTPFWVFSPLLFPYITSKAFYFRIVIELAVPLYVYLIIIDKKLRPNLRNPFNYTVLFFLLINIIASFAGVNVLRSLWGGFERMGGTYYLAHLVAVFFYVQLLGQAGGNYLKRFLQAFIWVATVVALNGLSGWVGGPTFTLDPSLPARVSSTFGNPIFFPSYLIFPMFLAAYFASLEENKTWKILYWISVAVQLVGIYSSGTRGAVVGLIAGLFIAGVLYVFLNKNSTIRRYGLVGIGACVIIAGGLFAYHDKLPPGSTLYRIANLRDSNAEARFIQWGIALKGYKDHPLLGVGPENYYEIANTYYNPELYKYDASWFDKPHNFLLEVLVTDGIFGLLAYVAMSVFAVYALWKAYKAELLSLLEMSLLLAAVITYQVQNLFVFDTVSSSIAFYAFLGFVTYLWYESSPVQETKPAKVISNNSNNGLASGLLLAGFVATFYVVYISNIESMEAAKRANLGFAYTDHDVQIAANYFESALSVPFNLDPRETANRYSSFVNKVYNSDLVTSHLDFVTDQVDKATAVQKTITEKTVNDPLMYIQYAVDEINYITLHKGNIEDAKPIIDKAVSLAPKRVEVLQLLMQYYGVTKDWPNAVKTAQQIVEINPYKADLKWQLSMAYYLNTQLDEAAKVGDDAVAQGFQFSQLQQFAWYIQYYEQKQDNAKVAPLLEQAINLEPQEVQLYIDLAKTYANLGNSEKARLLAQQVEQMDPTKKAEMEVFIKSLK